MRHGSDHIRSLGYSITKSNTISAIFLTDLRRVSECFCHYSRQHPDQGMPPDCVAPAAIVCSSSPQHWRPYPPPTYDELEPPPPPYSVLFPSSSKIMSTDDNPDELQSTSTAVTNDDVNSASIGSETNTISVPSVEVGTNNSDIAITVDT